LGKRKTPLATATSAWRRGQSFPAHVARQRGTGRRAAAARQSVELILGDRRLHLRQLGHLMPQRIGIGAPQPLVAAPATRGLERHDRS